MKSNLDAAVEAVLEAGVSLKQAFGNVKLLKHKEDQSVVTQLDIDTEASIEKKLRTHDSAIGFAGEESGVRTKADRFWLLDPIDGTQHFLRGIPFCTTMLALIEDRQVVLSVIYNFVTGELFTAEKGKGARCNGAPIHVSSRSLSESLIAVEAKLEREEHVSLYLELRKKTNVMQTVSAGYDFCLVASGKVEGRICFDPHGKDWDYAAGSLLVSEAGGVVANIGKTTYDFTDHDFLMTNKEVYEELTTGESVLFPIIH